MDNPNLRKALEANRFYYDRMYEAMRPVHEKIRLEKKQIINSLYREAAEIEARLQEMEAEFGYKYSSKAHKFNPYHDELGRFTFGPGGGSDNNRDGSTGVMVPGSGTVMDDAGNLYPADSSLSKPDGIPDDWMTNPANKGIGTKYTDPNNKGNEVRVMQGDPDSKYPVSQEPYVRWMNNGQWLDKAGNINPNPAETHIPLDDFEFIPEIFP